MRCWCLLLIFVLISACSHGPEADLQNIKQARSIAAEWALLNEQADAGRLTAKYITSMHHWFREGLETASESLSQPRSRYSAEIQALLAEPPNADPAELRRHADELKQIETELESA